MHGLLVYLLLYLKLDHRLSEIYQRKKTISHLQRMQKFPKPLKMRNRTFSIGKYLTVDLALSSILRTKRFQSHGKIQPCSLFHSDICFMKLDLHSEKKKLKNYFRYFLTRGRIYLHSTVFFFARMPTLL